MYQVTAQCLLKEIESPPPFSGTVGSKPEAAVMLVLMSETASVFFGAMIGREVRIEPHADSDSELTVNLVADDASGQDETIFVLRAFPLN